MRGASPLAGGRADRERDQRIVDVAKAFYDKKEAAFVNGLLDALAKDVRK